MTSVEAAARIVNLYYKHLISSVFEDPKDAQAVAMACAALAFCEEVNDKDDTNRDSRSDVC